MKIKMLVFLLLFASIPAPASFAGAPPDILNCTTEAKANGDYRLKKKSWLKKSGDYFTLGTKSNANGMRLGNKIFANLNTQTPVVRSFTEGAGQEFKALILQRKKNEVYLVWGSNPFDNKIWTAVINTSARTAAVSQVYSAGTSLGMDAELLTCE